MASARITLPATAVSFEVRTGYAHKDEDLETYLADEEVRLDNGTNANLKDAVYEWFCENATFEDVTLDPWEPDDDGEFW